MWYREKGECLLVLYSRYTRMSFFFVHLHITRLHFFCFLYPTDVMVFEDAGSLGSAVSGQQSPEPADQSKSSAEDAGVGGGSSSGGVLAGGTVVVTKSGRKETGKKFLRERASMFSMSRVTLRSPSVTTAGSGGGGGQGGDNSRVTVSPPSTPTNITQDPSHSPEIKTAGASVCTPPTRGSNNSSTSNSKPSRRTTSLLNLFVASTSFTGMWLFRVLCVTGSVAICSVLILLFSFR